MLVTRPSAQELERRRQTGAVLLRFVVLGTLLTLFVRFAMPSEFLDLPRHHAALWLAIMLLYPLLSVWPQEVIFRRFFFARYQAIFGNAGLVAASALAFGFAHIIFVNWVAVSLTLAGGAIFAADYARYRRLGLACLEHSLYGCLIFTIGLGRYFYTGAAWHL
jgi:membrane protease YdiL (CAAX protease family)